MATEVGSVLQVNFVQGEDYLQNVLVYEARAANAAANAKNSEIIAENAKNIAITKADEAANSAVQAKNSENIAKQSEINALNSATQAKESENNAKEYSDKTEAHYNQFYIDLTNIRNEFNTELEDTRNEFNTELADTRNEFNTELADTRNEFTIALNDTKNTFFNRLSDLRNVVSDGFYRFGNDISLINEWINLHNSAFQLTSFGLLDNNGVDIMDNDGVPFGGQMYMPITDRTLSLDGVPADAGAVGTALEKNRQESEQAIDEVLQVVHKNRKAIDDNLFAINELNKFVDSIDENFTFGDVCISDNNHEPLLDNDGVELLGIARMIVTDDTLTLQGIPADSYSVGEALSNQQKLLNGLDVIVQSWQDNFVQRVVPIADSDGNYILDNDNEELLNYAERLNTDSSLTMEGMPADAYAVGQALQAIRDLIATYHP
jgi:hypothetical protein